MSYYHHTSISDLNNDKKKRKRTIKKFSRRTNVLTLVIVVAILAGVEFWYLKTNAVRPKVLGVNQKYVQTPQEIQKLLENVGKMIQLPTDEAPTVAVVSDKAKLSDQPFFQNVENGDRILVYSKSKIAVLFRPSTGRIINYSKINLTPQSQPQSSPTPQETISPTSVPIVVPTKSVVVRPTTVQPTMPIQTTPPVTPSP